MTLNAERTIMAVAEIRKLLGDAHIVRRGAAGASLRIDSRTTEKFRAAVNQALFDLTEALIAYPPAAPSPAIPRVLTDVALPSGAPARDALFTLLEACAAAGQRCPTTMELLAALRRSACELHNASISYLLEELARAGKIAVNIHAKNWRTVEILAGLHAGKTTLPPPARWAVYKRADRAGYHRVEA